MAATHMYPIKLAADECELIPTLILHHGPDTTKMQQLTLETIRLVFRRDTDGLKFFA